MKRKFEWGAIVLTVFLIFIIRFGLLEGPTRLVYIDFFSKSQSKTDTENDPYDTYRHTQPNPLAQMPILHATNLSSLELSLRAWSELKGMLNRSDLPVTVLESFREGVLAWDSLVPQLDEGGSSSKTKEEKLCPDSVASTDGNGNEVALLCGLILDSTINVVGTPKHGSADFQIDFIGSNLPGDPGRPPVIFHYNVRFRGDLLTDKPVIIQNTWSSTSEWGEEERCPSPEKLEPRQVDGFDRCIEQVGALPWKPTATKDAGAGNWQGVFSGSEKEKPWFPFVEGMPFVASIWAGWDGFHVSVNGKHVSSFEYRAGYEPALVGKVHLPGGLKVSSVFATGLPMSENLAVVAGLEDLKAPLLQPRTKKAALFIGVFSSSSNFDRRMAQRKSWMQYDAVRSGDVVVRFFVGLHTQVQVNKELSEEAKTFGDLQLLKFVDYYHLITLKTAAICIFATQHMTAEHVMKTDDDTFVRVDVILNLIQSRSSDQSFLLGDVEFGAGPIRDVNSKWYISPEEYAKETYPPWAHGPGYIISGDIAEFVTRVSASKQLQMFKLEDVAMGIWIDEFQRSQNKTVEFLHSDLFHSYGCAPDYITAHYQSPKEMLCLWDRLVKSGQAVCC
ncbi:unnamed protein product [Calypogeia fissa]